MRILELFSGHASFSRIAKIAGHETFTVDYNPKFKPDMVIDIMQLHKKTLPQAFREPDVLWCSPPCETFSMAGDSWYMGLPTRSKSYLGLALAYKCVELIRELRPKAWFIENPRAGLRSAWFMRPLPRYTATYCQYGDDRMKPTDIWTNVEGWTPKCCNNGDNCHQRAPRGSKAGTQGEKSSEERAVIPDKLCAELMLAAEAWNLLWWRRAR